MSDVDKGEVIDLTVDEDDEIWVNEEFQSAVARSREDRGTNMQSIISEESRHNIAEAEEDYKNIADNNLQNSETGKLLISIAKH